MESAAFGELKAQIGNLELEAPDHQGAMDAQAVAFARPHGLELHRHRTGYKEIKTIIRFGKAIGPLVCLELIQKKDGHLIQLS